MCKLVYGKVDMAQGIKMDQVKFMEDSLLVGPLLNFVSYVECHYGYSKLIHF